ncbi:hypothetical protein AMTRI_Chr03g56200 [Amborella trichopoda]
MSFAAFVCFMACTLLMNGEEWKLRTESKDNYLDADHMDVIDLLHSSIAHCFVNMGSYVCLC